MTDLKPARYAPGDYLCSCFECGRQFAGDKRATRCKSCATLVTRIAELEAALRKISGGNWSPVAIDSDGANTLAQIVAEMQRIADYALARKS